MMNDSMLPASPDLSRLSLDDCEIRDFPAADQRQNGVEVVLRQSVLNEIYRHGDSTIDVEVCGVLVGNTCRDEQGAFVHVSASIRGAHAQSHNAQVTFTAETWQHIQTTLDSECAGQRILGWYHTHPGFGIFLSSMDRFIHDNFFGGHEQLALVYDPVHREQGLFVWRAGTPVPEQFIIEADMPTDGKPIRTLATQQPMVPRITLTAASGSGDGLSDLLARVEQLERQQRFLVVGLTAVMFVALAWPVSIAVSQFRREPVIETGAESINSLADPEVLRLKTKRRATTPAEQHPASPAKRPEIIP